MQHLHVVAHALAELLQVCGGQLVGRAFKSRAEALHVHLGGGLVAALLQQPSGLRAGLLHPVRPVKALGLVAREALDLAREDSRPLRRAERRAQLLVGHRDVEGLAHGCVQLTW